LKLVENHPALLLEKPVKTIVVADLHIGFEEELRQKGLKVPVESGKLAEELMQLINMTGAEKVIVLGDLKHNVKGPSRLETKILPDFISTVRKYVDEFVIVPGNHDGKLEIILGGQAVIAPSKGLFIEEEKVLLTHGHVKPDKHFLSVARTIITGHLHPVLRIGYGDAGTKIRIWLRLVGKRKELVKKLYHEKTSKLKGEVELLVMPSFNNILQGRSVNDLGISSLVRGPLLNSGAFELGEADIIALDGSPLGKLAELRTLLA